VSNSTTKTFGRITQLSLHGKIIHLSLQKKNKKRTLKKIGVNAVMAFTHPQQKKAFNNKKISTHVQACRGGLSMITSRSTPRYPRIFG